MSTAMGRAAAACIVAGTIAALGASAPANARVKWDTPGSYRLRPVAIGEFSLDAGGADTGQRFYSRHRLRIDPTLKAGDFKLHIQLDVLTGQVIGDVNFVGSRFVERRHGNPEREFDGWTRVEPRMLWFEWRSPIGAIRAGQMGSRWGMGLLAADGTGDREARDGEADRWVERFGDDWNGDLVQRLLVATKPLALVTHGSLGDVVVAAGIDNVYQDDQASWLDDDDAKQFIASIVYPGEEFFVGSYVAHRRQEDRDGERLDVTAFDVHGRWLLPVYTINADLRIEGEAVLLVGETDRLRPAASPDGIDIRQLGWAARGEISWHCPRVAAGVEVGYASGDSDPDDDEARDFTFDPDHKVGLILFPDVMRLTTLRAAERVADPGRAGEPPAGVEHLPTDGAVRNAIYAFPGVTWRPGQWRLTTAMLFAWGAEPVLDALETFAAGGTAKNHRGFDAARFYGWELDGAVHRRFGVDGFGAMSIGIEAGLFFSGPALGGSGDSEPVGKMVGRLDLRW